MGLFGKDKPEPIDRFDGEHEFLSNFHVLDVPILMDGYSYPTVEHAYQAAKTMKRKERKRIRQCATPGQAKRLGNDKQKTAYGQDWEWVKVDIMRSLVFPKFLMDDKLAGKLLQTGDRKLIEGNTWNDTFWGVCRGHGRNELGKILMEARQILQTLRQQF